MSTQRAVLTMLLGLTLLLSGCAGEGSPLPGEGAYQRLTPQEAYSIMESYDGYILLNVRTREEYEEAHIRGAWLLPDDEVSDKAEVLLPDQEAVILVYCRSGRRSARSAKLLIDLGYKNVYDFGGIIDWPYATVSGAEGE